jgi:exodeoxyribonuclease VII small subunit
LYLRRPCVSQRGRPRQGPLLRQSLESGFCPFHLRAHHAQGPRHPPHPTEPPSYEAALQELEQLVGRLESGQVPLEELMGYQRGAELLQFCRDRLDAVENQIKVLDEGTLKTVDARVTRRRGGF